MKSLNYVRAKSDCVIVCSNMHVRHGIISFKLMVASKQRVVLTVDIARNLFRLKTTVRGSRKQVHEFQLTFNRFNVAVILWLACIPQTDFGFNNVKTFKAFLNGQQKSHAISFRLYFEDKSSWVVLVEAEVLDCRSCYIEVGQRVNIESSKLNFLFLPNSPKLKYLLNSNCLIIQIHVQPNPLVHQRKIPRMTAILLSTLLTNFSSHSCLSRSASRHGNMAFINLRLVLLNL